MSQQVASQLDIVLCNSNGIGIDYSCDNRLGNSLSKKNQYFFDQSPLRSEILLKLRRLPNADANRNADWQNFNESIENEPF